MPRRASRSFARIATLLAGTVLSACAAGGESFDVGPSVDAASDLAVVHDNGLPDAPIDVRPDVGFDVAPTDSPPDRVVPDGAMACSTDRDCHTFSLSRCDPDTGTCVHCLPTGTRICSIGYFCSDTHTCTMGCASDVDCGGGANDAGALHCDTASHHCLGCSGDSDCALGQLCSNGACLPGCSMTHGCNFGQTCCSGMCLNTSTDVTHCGACSTICSAVNGAASCNAGVCGLACNAGFADCNNMIGDGCEADTLTSATNCGGCAMACNPAHATGGCMAGVCALTDCAAGYQDCDRNPANGCEVAVSTDGMNCGRCGRACAMGDVCVAGVCGCPAGQMRCNGTCVSTVSSAMNCGACGNVCPMASPFCVGGQCRTVQLYHGWTSPVANCSTTSYNTMAPTNQGGFYPFNTGDSDVCRAWKLAATVCTTMPMTYFDAVDFTCPMAGGFTDPAFGTFCAVANQYACTGCPAACNAGCIYHPLSLRNCAGAEANQP